MLLIGEHNELVVDREVDFGFYLEDSEGNSVLLPKSSYNGHEINVNDKVNAFVYRDSEDRPVATLKEPLIEVNKIAYLKIVGQSKIGAFADMGLERDIFIPIKEQKFKLIVGKKYLLYAYLDKTNRLAATTFVDSYIGIGEGYKVDQDVNVIVYGKGGEKTIRVAIDGKYQAIILGNEHFRDLFPGDQLDVRVRKIYEDGVIGVTARKKRLDARDILKQDILTYLQQNGGSMVYNDKSSPEDIKEVFKTSKNYFKMALGGLMKEGKITQDSEGTKLK